MSKPIFITARFRSGSTLLWNFFHQLPDAQAYYEPLHEQLPELIQWNIAPQSRHYNVDSYFQEFPGVDDLKRHHSPEFGLLRLYLEENDAYPELKNYIEYLLDFSKPTKIPVLQFNRIDFRLPWMKKHFPEAILIHLYRSPRDQWISTISDVANEIDLDIDSDAYRITTWSRDLCQQFPFLTRPFLKHAYQRFYYLWKLSFLAGQIFSDYSIAYEEFLLNPSESVKALFSFVGLDTPENLQGAKKIIVERPVGIWKNYQTEAWFQEMEENCETLLDRTGLNKQFGKRPLHEIIASNPNYQNIYLEHDITNWIKKNSQLTILNLMNIADQKESAIQGISSANQQLINSLKERENLISEQDQIIRSFRYSLGFWLRNSPLRHIPRLRPIINLLIRIRRFFLPRIGVLEQYPPDTLRIPTYYREPFEIDKNRVPTISIVTPSFNQAQFIERTVKSVLDQAYPKLEYIIQDGQSTDATINILELYRKDLDHFASRKDKGQANAINLGFKQTSGEIMAFLNSDDILLPGCLGYVGEYFSNHPEVDVIYSHRVIIDENDQEIGRWVMPPHEPNILHWVDYIPQETMFWRRSIWDKVGSHMDESFQFALDWDLLLRFQKAGANIVRVPRFLSAFRVHKTQKTSAQINERGLIEMDRIRKEIHGHHVTWDEIEKNTRKYLRKSILYHKLYRLGILRY